MVDQYMGEIKLVGFNFAPIGWAECQGQIVSIQQYAALFALYGTMYGGNGTTNFGWPDLQGRAAGHVGPSLYTVQGMKLGTETVTINSTTYPIHNHSVQVNAAGANTSGASAHYLATTSPNTNLLYAAAQGAPMQPLYNQSPQPVISVASGGSQPHENMMPFLTMNYVLAISGQFPSRG
jgi:microcystin-dependent protein